MTLALEIERDDTLWNGTIPASDRGPQKWVGCEAGSYRLLQHLGSGGMGHVFLAAHMTLGLRAAVKILPVGSTNAQKIQFRDEARLLALQNHPNIAHLLDVGSMDDGSNYIVMEYASGIDLECWLTGGEERSPARVLRILRQLACAIDHLHGQGILHRDIKPANVMIEPEADDAVTLVDFGVATRECTEHEASDPMVFGTPAYMAPEQAAGEPATRACDLYALGALALELLTGKPPYDYSSVNMTLAAVLHEKPSLPSERGVCMPALDRFFERALAREPQDRFTSARVLVEALECVFRTTGGAQKSRATWRVIGSEFAHGALAAVCVAVAKLS